MRPGTPGFVGARLREAREARGLTGIALAELVGVTRQAIAKYEGGDSSPSPDVLLRAMAVLRLPSEFFLRPPDSAEDSTIFYRSLAAATKSARARGERRLEWLASIASFAQGFVAFPEVNVPEAGDDPESAASVVRAAWGLGDAPVGHVAWLLENNGAVITRGVVDTHTIDAFSRWHLSGRPMIFLGSDKESAVRSRFDAAHELGHMVMHRGMARRDFAKGERFKQVETQAHDFASSFLLPAAAFAQDLWTPTLETMQLLKPKWGTSIGAMIKRAERLGMLSQDAAERLWISRARRGWSRNEPLDETMEVEEPRLLRRSFELIVEEAGISREAILAKLPFSPRDIADLAGLPGAYLDDSEAPVRLIERVAPGARPPEGDDGTRGSLVSFRKRISSA